MLSYLLVAYLTENLFFRGIMPILCEHLFEEIDSIKDPQKVQFPFTMWK